MARLPRVAAVAVTLAAAVLATTSQAPAPAATRPSSGAHVSAAPPAHTHLRLHITGCDRCTVTLQRAVSGNPAVWTSPPQRVGADHRVTFRMLTSRTHGLSFVLRAPWQGDTGAVPNIVTRYRGHGIGSFVSRSAARHGRRAEGCWAGTTRDVVTLDFHVGRVAAKTLTGDPTRIPLAYATHTLASWKPVTRTFKGTIANQDAFYCSPPAQRQERPATRP